MTINSVTSAPLLTVMFVSPISNPILQWLDKKFPPSTMAVPVLQQKHKCCHQLILDMEPTDTYMYMQTMHAVVIFAYRHFGKQFCPILYCSVSSHPLFLHTKACSCTCKYTKRQIRNSKPSHLYSKHLNLV